MTETTPQAGHETGRKGLDGQKRLFAARLATGLVHGAALYLLYRAADAGTWPKTQPEVFGGLALAAGYAPLVVLAGVGRVKPAGLAAWTVIAALVLFLLGWRDVARQVLKPEDQAPFLSFPVMAFAAAALFIAHHLVVPALQQRRWLVDFHDYFDTAWKAGVQLVLSLAFTLAFYLLLWLGAALFQVIGVEAFGKLIGQAWFAIPANCLAFAIAAQLTDVRDGLIRGVRTVALMLLSWLLPVIALLIAAFLAALPFTGVDSLWDTRSATSLVLSAAAILIVLINTAYQDGRADNLPPLVLRVATRFAGVLVAPLIGLAFWGLALRIGQHGLTPDRIIALACAVTGGVHAVGYLIAAVKPGAWMKPLELTNIVAALVTVATILALFSPLLDPMRLSAGDQTARLLRGAVSPDRFDYEFLRFDSGKAGQAALARLSRSDNAEIARRAAQAARQDTKSYRGPDEHDQDQDIGLTAIDGRPIPPGLTDQIRATADIASSCAYRTCSVLRLDLDDDGRDEALIASPAYMFAYAEKKDGSWRKIGRYQLLCGGDAVGNLADWLKQAPRPARPLLPDLVAGDARLQGQRDCASPP